MSNNTSIVPHQSLPETDFHQFLSHQRLKYITMINVHELAELKYVSK